MRLLVGVADVGVVVAVEGIYFLRPLLVPMRLPLVSLKLLGGPKRSIAGVALEALAVSLALPVVASNL